MANDGCVHTKSLSVSLPAGGDVVYGVGHQHTGGVGSTLYGEVFEQFMHFLIQLVTNLLSWNDAMPFLNKLCL